MRVVAGRLLPSTTTRRCCGRPNARPRSPTTTPRASRAPRRWRWRCCWPGRGPTRPARARDDGAFRLRPGPHGRRRSGPATRSTSPARVRCPRPSSASWKPTDWRDAVRLAVSLGGDADTQACIAGAWPQARFGGVPGDIERDRARAAAGPPAGHRDRLRERTWPRSRTNRKAPREPHPS